MRRAVFKGSFLYVEGPTDEKFYRVFIDDSQCQIIIAYSRVHVVEACRILENSNFSGVIGIVDADFDHLEATTVEVSCVFQTDMHDCECFMLATMAFDKVLTEFSSKDKLTAWQKSYVTDIRDHLLRQAVVIGGLLWHSNKSELRLCFDELEAKEFVDHSDLKVDVARFVRHVKNKSQRHDLSDEQLTAGIQERLKTSDKMWQIVRGRDLIILLGFAFRRTLGCCTAQEVTREHIEQGLRLAYAEDDFFQTQLFIRIRVWEDGHPPFRVFRDFREGVGS